MMEEKNDYEHMVKRDDKTMKERTSEWQDDCNKMKEEEKDKERR